MTFSSFTYYLQQVTPIQGLRLLGQYKKENNGHKRAIISVTKPCVPYGMERCWYRWVL